MTWPTVTEVSRALEPVTRDTFVDGLDEAVNRSVRNPARHQSEERKHPCTDTPA